MHFNYKVLHLTSVYDCQDKDLSYIGVFWKQDGLDKENEEQSFRRYLYKSFDRIFSTSSR